MAAPRPTFRAEVPPPDLPSMPEVSNTLTQYLRTFSLWCRHGFADKLSGTVAQPGLMLQAYDAAPGTTPKVFIVRVSSAGLLTATPMSLGGGQP